MLQNGYIEAGNLRLPKAGVTGSVRLQPPKPIWRRDTRWP